MRIQYTLPGLQPGPLQDKTPVTTDSASLRASFKTKLRRLASAVPADWKEILRLDRPRPCADTIGPPPRPASLEVKDLASERNRWRNLIAREREFGEGPRVREMLAVLRNYQRMEDAVVARHLAETRG